MLHHLCRFEQDKLCGSVQWRLRPFSYGQALAFLRGPWAVHCACINDGGLVTCSATPLVAAAVLGATALLLLLILLLGWSSRCGHIASISSTQQSDTDASGAMKDSLTPSVRCGAQDDVHLLGALLTWQ